MTTEDFNKQRISVWETELSKREARLFLILGYRKDGTYTFIADDNLTPLKIAERFEGLARAIRFSNIKNS